MEGAGYAANVKTVGSCSRTSTPRRTRPGAWMLRSERGEVPLTVMELQQARDWTPLFKFCVNPRRRRDYQASVLIGLCTICITALRSTFPLNCVALMAVCGLPRYTGNRPASQYLERAPPLLYHWERWSVDEGLCFCASSLHYHGVVELGFSPAERLVESGGRAFLELHIVVGRRECSSLPAMNSVVSSASVTDRGILRF